MGAEQKDSLSEDRQGWCPVYDLECPAGEAAADACDHRFKGDYNPLTSYRDADITHCALYRQDQQRDSAKQKQDGGEGAGND